MKTLENILESLLDSSFDIGDGEVLTLRQAGYYCTNMACNDNFGRYINSGQIKKILGINISQVNGENPYARDGLKDYCSETLFHAKVKAGRDGMGMGAWRFAWLIRLVMDHCHPTAESIRDFIEQVHPSIPDIKVTKNKIIVKATQLINGRKGNMSMTFTKR